MDLVQQIKRHVLTLMQLKNSLTVLCLQHVLNLVLVEKQTENNAENQEKMVNVTLLKKKFNVVNSVKLKKKLLIVLNTKTAKVPIHV